MLTTRVKLLLITLVMLLSGLVIMAISGVKGNLTQVSIALWGMFGWFGSFWGAVMVIKINTWVDRLEQETRKMSDIARQEFLAALIKVEEMERE